MSLPEKLRKQVLAQFDELIAEGEAIRAAMTCVAPRNGLVPSLYQFDIGRMREWLTRCVSLLDHAIPNSSIHRKWVEQLSAYQPDSGIPLKVVPKLRAIRNDLESGLFDNLIQRLDAAIASDYMGQADGLLEEGQRGNHDHVPAAVLAGAVLERHLRELCQKQNPPIDLVDVRNGKPYTKTMVDFITDLKKIANLYDEPMAAQLRAWAAIRNKAAHGEFDKFDRQQVEAMVLGIKQFLVTYN